MNEKWQYYRSCLFVISFLCNHKLQRFLFLVDVIFMIRGFSEPRNLNLCSSHVPNSVCRLLLFYFSENVQECVVIAFIYIDHNSNVLWNTMIHCLCSTRFVIMIAFLIIWMLQALVANRYKMWKLQALLSWLCFIAPTAGMV